MTLTTTGDPISSMADFMDHPVVRTARLFRLAQRLGPVIREAEEFIAAERDERGRLRWLREDGTRQ